MFDKIFDDKAEKIKKDFDKRLAETERNVKVQLDRMEKKIDDLATNAK
ncbi:MAG: hypothetical protein V1854_03520 [Methanobacteriota archaeon]